MTRVLNSLINSLNEFYFSNFQGKFSFLKYKVHVRPESRILMDQFVGKPKLLKTILENLFTRKPNNLKPSCL